MRQIKFRGRTRYGEWLYGDLVQRDGEVHIFPPDGMDSVDNYEVAPDTVGQFTGLQDKNGVDIYEGDIIQLYQCPDTSQSVIFKRGAFGYMVDFLKSFVPLAHMEEVQGDGRVEWVILRNIHDNSQMIK